MRTTDPATPILRALYITAFCVHDNKMHGFVKLDVTFYLIRECPFKLAKTLNLSNFFFKHAIAFKKYLE